MLASLSEVILALMRNALLASLVEALASLLEANLEPPDGVCEAASLDTLSDLALAC